MAEERKPYKPSFNIQAYNVIDRVDLSIRETHPSREIVDLYSENNYYGGISFFFDNIGKIIWVWIARYTKHKDWAKKIVNEKNPDKFKKLVHKILEDELDKTIEGYEIHRVEEGNHPDDFELLFLYEIQEFELYNQHYYRADVQMLMPQEATPVEQTVTKCPKCGWILTKGKTKCPRCQTVVSSETPENAGKGDGPKKSFMPAPNFEGMGSAGDEPPSDENPDDVPPADDNPPE